MKHIVLTITTILISVHLSFAQAKIDAFKKKVEGTILLANGKKLTGAFRIPQIGRQTISYFKDAASKRDIPSDSISQLFIKNNAGHYSVLSYTHIGYYKKAKGKWFAKKKKKKYWILEVVSGKKAKLYVSGNRYKQMADGNIDAVSDGHARNPASFSYYGKMEGRDEFPIFIDMDMGGITVGGNAFFKAYASRFFKETDDVLSNKIKNKEENYKNKNRVQIFLDFNGM